MSQDNAQPAPAHPPYEGPADDGSAPYSGGPAGQGHHEVRPGECLDSIAAEHGFYWETLWDHGENRCLREARESPFLLRAGDRVYVPELTLRTERAPTGQRTVFRQQGAASVLKLRIYRGGLPRAGERYTLDIDGALHDGELDKEGRLRVCIPPNARRGRLKVGTSHMSPGYDLYLGYLDPVAELTGVQARLANLGFDCTVTGELDKETEAALAEFQQQERLEPSGRPDQKTRDALVRMYES